MSIAATVKFGGTIRETVASGVDFAPNAVIPHVIGGTLTYSDSTVPDGELFSGAELALTAGAVTVDLTALEGVNTTVDGDGKRPRFIYIKNNGAAAMTFTKGASNGSTILGTTWTVIVAPGKMFQQECADDVPAISATVKTIDVTGTGTETFDLAIIIG